jgi:hypothetical protein
VQPEDEPQAGGIEELDVRQVEDEVIEARLDQLADCAFELGRGRDVQFAHRRYPDAIALREDLAAIGRRQHCGCYRRSATGA